jgi:ABC-type transporter Mla MlaB component
LAAPSSSIIVYALRGPIAPKDVRWMCERVRSLLEASDDGHVICDVGAVTEPDAGTVEALARMQLTAQRLGGRLKLRRACGELRDLLRMSGLSDVVPCDELLLEAGRHAEQGEPTRGVQEEGDPADPVA